MKDKVEWRASCFLFVFFLQLQHSAEFSKGRCFQLLILLLFLDNNLSPLHSGRPSLPAPFAVCSGFLLI